MANVAGSMDEPRKPHGGPAIPKSKRGLKGYFNEVGRELKKVSWPTKAETNRLTGVVLGVCALVVVVLVSLSYVFDAFIKFITTGSF